MLKGLQQRTIALAGGRKSEELTAMIEKNEGQSVVCPIQGTSFLREEAVLQDIEKVLAAEPDWFMLTTGMGARKIQDVAEQANKKDDWITALNTASIASRGRKTQAYLADNGLSSTISDEDGTIRLLLKQWLPTLKGTETIAVQLYDHEPEWVNDIRDTGCSVVTLQPYVHEMPPEETLAELLDHVLQHRVNAVAFTSATQVRHLFTYAKKANNDEALQQAFNRQDVVAGSVGKVTSEALHEEGVTSFVESASQRMGDLIVQLANHLESVSNR
ncbi:uroporphyrinogen-III synthase [Aureibacillus halotolerans]|uniref:Uroporphyrinogen-III synthase n=1 Tax=Aureibacillus halotolerans TaxID=1508390 RepID=A0A4R6U3S5_9BACI|nr:uroporphyrinogen-III synthase [Aureibacillus halotolerans]TDQ40691.1 uroporphyrinogen-III synthase [Aureibacillus halotolerans]